MHHTTPLQQSCADSALFKCFFMPFSQSAHFDKFSFRQMVGILRAKNEKIQATIKQSDRQDQYQSARSRALLKIQQFQKEFVKIKDESKLETERGKVGRFLTKTTLKIREHIEMLKNPTLETLFTNLGLHEESNCEDVAQLSQQLMQALNMRRCIVVAAKKGEILKTDGGEMDVLDSIIATKSIRLRRDGSKLYCQIKQSLERLQSRENVWTVILEMVQQALHRKQGTIEFEGKKSDQLWSKAFQMFKAGNFCQTLLLCHLQFYGLKDFHQYICARLKGVSTAYTHDHQSPFFKEMLQLLSSQWDQCACRDQQSCPKLEQYNQNLYTTPLDYLWRLLKLLTLHNGHRAQTLRYIKRFSTSHLPAILNELPQEMLLQETELQCYSLNHAVLLSVLRERRLLTKMECSLLVGNALMFRVAHQQTATLEETLFECLKQTLDSAVDQAFLHKYLMAFLPFIPIPTAINLLSSSQTHIQYLFSSQQALQWLFEHLQFPHETLTSIVNSVTKMFANHDYFIRFFMSYFADCTSQTPRKSFAPLMKEPASSIQRPILPNRKKIDQNLQIVILQLLLELIIRKLEIALKEEDMLERGLIAHESACRLGEGKLGDIMHGKGRQMKLKLATFLHNNLRISHAITCRDYKMMITVYNYILDLAEETSRYKEYKEYAEIMKDLGISSVVLLSFVDKVLLSMWLLKALQEKVFVNKDRFVVVLAQCEKIAKAVAKVNPHLQHKVEALNEVFRKASRGRGMIF